MKKIWLDDYRHPPDKSWIWVKSLEEFKTTLIQMELISHISFDHDLNKQHYGGDYSDQQTGFEAILYLAGKKLEYYPMVNVHTRNPSRRRLMTRSLKDAGFRFVDNRTCEAIQEHVIKQDQLISEAACSYTTG